MRVGELDVMPMHDGRLVFAEPAGFPAKDTPEFAPHRDYIVDGRWLLDLGAFVVRSGERLVLLDAGAGPGSQTPTSFGTFQRVEDVHPAVVEHWRKLGKDDAAMARAMQLLGTTEISTGALADSLAAANIEPSEITDVVLSHLHYDHIGWVSRDGAPFFPNATYRVERRDLDFFLGPENHGEAYFAAVYGAMPTSQRLAPVLDRLEPWDGDVSIAPGIDMRFAPGHTPGSCLAVLSSGTERAMILGDTVHCPLELMDPDFSLMGDMDQSLADRTRDRIRRELEADPTIPVSSQHFPELRFGRLLPGQGKHGWVFE